MDKAAKESVRNLVDMLFWGVVGGLVLTLALFVFFRVSPYSLISVSGPSMEPTLVDGDLLIIEKTPEPQRDQMAIFTLPEEWTPASSTESKLIKRVVGLPGDRLTFEGDRALIESKDGELTELVEPKILSCNLEDGKELEIPDGFYFLAGDNRVESYDSMTAWCSGLDPLVPQESIGVSGEVKVRLTWPSFLRG